jgi:hypothetical protein
MWVYAGIFISLPSTNGNMNHSIAMTYITKPRGVAQESNVENKNLASTKKNKAMTNIFLLVRVNTRYFPY